MAKDWTPTVSDEELDALTRYDICPDIDSYLSEIEHINGVEITEGVMRDVLSDFATFPAGTTYDQITRTVNRLAAAYFGK